jgi:hypothetical protein
MKDVNFSECKFSADMVPYMYAELPTARSAEFESHLLECTSCTDEFASLSSARFEVYDWKKLEFDALPTPRFAIPFVSDTEASSHSWIEKLRAVSSAGWAIPGVAFGGLVIASILAGIFVLSGSDQSEIAANVGGSNASVVETVRESIPEKAAAPVRSGSEDTVKEAARPASVRASVSKQVSGPRSSNAASMASRRVSGLKDASARNVRKVPRLNEFTEEEDNSLRLAELFDDLDTRN